MAVSVLASGNGVSYDVNLGVVATAPGDIVVWLCVNSATVPAAPTGVTGCGATWSQVFTSARAFVWIGTAPTGGGIVTATLPSGLWGHSAWILRGASPDAIASWATVNGSSTMTASAEPVGPHQAVLAVAFPVDTLPGSTALPSPGAWTAAAAVTNKRAWAVPGVSDTYQATASRATSSRQVLLQAVIGTPPPPAPTALVLTPSEIAIDVSWTAPPGGGSVTGYTISLDGAAPIDIGNVTSWTFSGLTPATLYAVDVRAYNAGGAGPALSGSTTTLTPPEPTPAGAYTVDVRIGDPGPDAHEWTVTRHALPDYGPVAGLALGWTAPQDQGWPTQPNPIYAALQVITETAAELGDVDQGTPLWIRFTPDPDCDPEDIVEFSGLIRDASSRPHELGQVLTVKALDHLLDERLTQSTGVITWVEDQPINDRYAYLENLLDTSYDIPGFDIPTDVSGGFFTDGPATPSTVLQLLINHLAFTLAGGRNIVTPNIDADGTLDAVEPFVLVNVEQVNNDPASALDAGVVPTQSVEWTRIRIEPNAIVDDRGLVIDERPHLGVGRVITRPGLVPATWLLNAHDVPMLWGSRFRTHAHLDYPSIRGWFDLPHAMNQLVEIANIDARHNPNGTADHAGLLAGAVLTIPADGNWYVDFDLRRSLHGPTP